MGDLLANDLQDLINKLKKVDTDLAKTVAPKVNNLFKEAVNQSISNYYASYSPRMYARTGNFGNVPESATTMGVGETITMKVNSGVMGNYSGAFGTPLSANSAYNMFFMGGQHGHGMWLMAVSEPPYNYVTQQVNSGFGGKINGVMQSALQRILG